MARKALYTPAQKIVRQRAASLRWYYKNRELSAKTQERLRELDHIAATGTKHCPVCDEHLPVDDFYVIEANRDGLSKECAACRSSIASENYHRRKSAHPISASSRRARGAKNSASSRSPRHSRGSKRTGVKRTFHLTA